MISTIRQFGARRAVTAVLAIGLAGGGGTKGLQVIYGSVIIAGLFTFFLAPYFSKLIKFFPPVVTGSVITIIGISLLPECYDCAGSRTSPASHFWHLVRGAIS